MSRLAEVFPRGRRPRCAKCGKPAFVLLDHLMVCDSRDKHDRNRTCGTPHYVMQDPHGNSVVIRVTEDEVAQVKASDLPTATLHQLGLPQMAREMLDGARRAA